MSHSTRQAWSSAIAFQSIHRSTSAPFSLMSQMRFKFFPKSSASHAHTTSSSFSKRRSQPLTSTPTTASKASPAPTVIDRHQATRNESNQWKDVSSFHVSSCLLMFSCCKEGKKDFFFVVARNEVLLPSQCSFGFWLSFLFFFFFEKILHMYTLCLSSKVVNSMTLRSQWIWWFLMSLMLFFLLLFVFVLRAN